MGSSNALLFSLVQFS